MRVVVLTTSYPRTEGDVAGTFVRDAVEGLRAEGVEVEVVSPAAFRHYGIAYGAGIPGNLRARPWLVLLLPAFLLGFARAARQAARDADVVLAHWLPSAIPALATRRPLVVQLWGSDVVLARKLGPLARLLLGRARAVICASEALAADARALGAQDVHVIPAGVALPADVPEPDEPAHVLYAGRLSEEKGILDFLAATEGLPRVIVGDGPLRDRVPEAVGFVAPAAVGAHYARAAVVCVPSRREGYGFTAREAMAHGRPVVATRAGGLIDAIEDGVTGRLVEPGDVAGLREAIVGLLGDPARRTALGTAAQAHAVAAFSRASAARATVGVLAAAAQSR